MVRILDASRRVCPESSQRIASFSEEFAACGGLQTIVGSQEKVGSAKCRFHVHLPSAVRWLSGRKRRFAKPLYGLKPVPRVRIPASPPVPRFARPCRRVRSSGTPRLAFGSSRAGSNPVVTSPIPLSARLASGALGLQARRASPAARRQRARIQPLLMIQAKAARRSGAAAEAGRTAAPSRFPRSVCRFVISTDSWPLGSRSSLVGSN
jgi:hypothetical protein